MDKQQLPWRKQKAVGSELQREGLRENSVCLMIKKEKEVKVNGVLLKQSEKIYCECSSLTRTDWPFRTSGCDRDIGDAHDVIDWLRKAKFSVKKIFNCNWQKDEHILIYAPDNNYFSLCNDVQLGKVKRSFWNRKLVNQQRNYAEIHTEWFLWFKSELLKLFH